MLGKKLVSKPHQAHLDFKHSVNKWFTGPSRSLSIARWEISSFTFECGNFKSQYSNFRLQIWKMGWAAWAVGAEIIVNNIDIIINIINIVVNTNFSNIINIIINIVRNISIIIPSSFFFAKISPEVTKAHSTQLWY